MLQNLDILKKTHKADLEGLYNIYSRKKFYKSITFPTIISCCTYLAIFINTIDYYDLATRLIDLILTIMPSLLGFMLGAYAILIGFGNKDFLKTTTKISDEKPISFYQTFSSIFAFSLLSMVVTLLTGCVFYIFSLATPLEFFIKYIDYVNILSIIILIYLIIYSIYQTLFAVLNVFSLAQSYHMYLLGENYKDEISKINKQKHGNDRKTNNQN